MSSISLPSSLGNSPPTPSNGFFPSSSKQCNYPHHRSPVDVITDSSYLQSNGSFHSSDEKDHIPEGLLSKSMYYAHESFEIVCFQLTNWYTRISLLIGYLMMLLLTLIFLTIAGYFDLNTWGTLQFEQEKR